MKIETRGKQIKSGTAAWDMGKNVFRYYVGIDPDVDKSGYAVYSKKDKKLIQCTALSFFTLYEVLQLWSEYKQPNKVVIHIEGAWLEEKSNWHTKSRFGMVTEKEKRIGERISKNVGSNHAVGKLIVDMCIRLELSFVVREVVTPLFKDENQFKNYTKWAKATNADARSAANYVFGF